METGRELEVSVKLAYAVRHVDSARLTELEQGLHSALQLVEDKNGHKVYDVEATKVEPIFDAIYKDSFQNDKSVHEPYVLFVVNPDKRRILDKSAQTPVPPLESITDAVIEEQEARFTYRYMYQGGGTAAAWVGAGRFAVVDLGAGPCVFGRLGVSEGTVGPGALPRLGPLLSMYTHETTKLPASDPAGREAAQSARARHVIGAISTLAVSAVKHLFAPDMRAETLDFAQRVLMPVIVLRNHHAFDPLAPGHAHSLDLNLIRSEAKSMLQGRQELVVVEGTHSLHEHERLSLAVAHAVTSVSTATTGADGHYSLQTRAILDSQVLLDEMHRAADMLASGLIGLKEPDLATAFYDPDIPLDDKIERGSAARSPGTRVVPVYVVSLAGTPADLLLDGEALVAGGRDLVMALQLVTNASSVHDDAPAVPLRFLSEGQVAKVRPQDTTRHIVAGVASALAGIASPTERWSTLHGRRQESYMWAVGAHPFGPFSNSSSMGAIFKDSAQRNDILSRTDTALRQVREALREVDGFVAKYMRRPFGDTVNASAATESWLDQLYHDPDRKHAPLPHTIVQQMETELKVLERLFIKLSKMLYNHNMKEAKTLASSTLITTHTFSKFVRDQIDKANDALRCCRLEHTMPQHSMAYTYAAILVAGITVYWMVIYFAQPKQRDRYHYGRY